MAAVARRNRKSITSRPYSVRCGTAILTLGIVVLPAATASAMQPCPPGTSVWTVWTVGALSLFVLLALVGVALLVRATFRARRWRRRLLLGGATLLTLLVAAFFGFALLIRITWSGTCY